jgi:hypothetical protein
MKPTNYALPAILLTAVALLGNLRVPRTSADGDPATNGPTSPNSASVHQDIQLADELAALRAALEANRRADEALRAALEANRRADELRDELIRLHSAPTGTVLAYAANTDQLPQGWLFCDGSPLPEGPLFDDLDSSLKGL